MDYNELLNQWAEKIYLKADSCKDKREYEKTGSWKDGYYKGLNEAYIMSITELTILEKKHKPSDQKEDIEWLLKELLEAGKYAEVDFDKITEIAYSNGYKVDEDLDLVEIIEE